MEDSGGRVRSSTHTKRQREEHTSKGLVSSTTGSRHCTRVRRQQPRENREETPDTLQEKKKKTAPRLSPKLLLSGHTQVRESRKHGSGSASCNRDRPKPPRAEEKNIGWTSKKQPLLHFVGSLLMASFSVNRERTACQYISPGPIGTERKDQNHKRYREEIERRQRTRGSHAWWGVPKNVPMKKRTGPKRNNWST